MNHLTLFIVVATLVVLPLAFYAGTLLFKLKNQNDEQKAAAQKRNIYLLTSIETIAAATVQQQCSVSEAVVRIFNLNQMLSESLIIRLTDMYPASLELYDAIKDHPILEERSKLPNKERMKLDLIREEKESLLETKILAEMAALKTESESMIKSLST